MKKLFLIMLIMALAAGTLAACRPDGAGGAGTGAKPGGGDQASGTGEGRGGGAAYNRPDFEEITDMNALPADIASGIDKLSKSRGFVFFKTGDAYIVSVNSGERSTGGYAIKVKSAEDVEGTTRITVEETSPEKDAMVIQALTYPFTVVKIKGSAGNFKVAGVNGDVFDMLSDGDLKVINAGGVYSGQIDDNSVEIYVNGEPGAFRINRSFDAVLNSLGENDRVSLSYFKNEQGQQVLIGLEKQK